MKLTALLLFFFTMQALARTDAQTVSFSGKNVSLRQIFTAIKKQTGYFVVFNANELQKSKPVTVTVKDEQLTNFLQMILEGQPLEFTIEKKTIVIGSKSPVSDKAIDVKSIWDFFIPPPVTVHGKVFDNTGKPLENASVHIKGAATLVSTNKNGEFVITAGSDKDVLVFSLVGYIGQETRIDGKSVINIKLIAVDNSLEETVVVGYGTKKISELTGAVQKVTGETLNSGVSSQNALAMLKGVGAGLYIVENGGSVATRGQVIMHGQASLPDASNTNFGPLIVVDGVINTAANLQDIVDPNDIESITILKDAASTAIYGSRAAQGVMVVTTKRGVAGALKVGLTMNAGKTQNNRLVNFMNTPTLTNHITQYMQALYTGTPSLQTTYGSFTNYYNTTRPFTDADLQNDYDWSNKALFPNGAQSDINLSLQSGTDKTKFYGAVDWLKQDGTVIDDKLDRKNIRINIDQKINDRFSVSINANALLDKYTASSNSNSTSAAYLYQPWVTPYYANGQLADSIPQYLYRATGTRNTQYYANPLYRHELNTAITNRQNFIGSGVLRYAITPWLTIQSTNTYQYTYNNVNTYRDPRTYLGRYNGAANSPYYMNGELFINDTRSTYWLTSNTISFNKRFGDHQVTALAGQEFGRTHSENILTSGYNTPYPGERNLAAFLGIGNGPNTWIYLSNGLALPITSSPSLDKASFSMFSQVNDNYKGKYFASASLRRDASTNFGKLNRYGTFYSASAGWLLTKEKFMTRIKPVTNLKLRASYGTSGREAGADFLNFTTYAESTSIAYNNSGTTGAAIQRLGNNEITWETTYTTDIGLDIGLWNRVNLTVDFYNRRSSGLLQNATLPSYQGSLTQLRNIGELKNRGIDIILSTTNIRSRDFSWTTDFNISFNTNKLTKLYGDSLLDNFTGSYYRYIGEDINTLRAIQYAGVNPANGRPLFQRIGSDKSITLVDSIPLVKQDGLRGFQNVGSATPKFFGGITNTFRYRGISLSFLINFVYGNKIFNNNERNFLSPSGWTSGYDLVQPGKNMKFWQAPGDASANYSNFYDLAFSQRGLTNINSSLLYQDASYLRLRNVRLGYDLPQQLLKKARISSVNIYVSADNVFVIKSKEMFAADPEGATIGTTASNAYAGTGFYSALPRRFMAGINLVF